MSNSKTNSIYGFAGHDYSHTLGDDKSDFNYHDEFGSLEFEHNAMPGAELSHLVM